MSTYGAHANVLRPSIQTSQTSQTSPVPTRRPLSLSAVSEHRRENTHASETSLSLPAVYRNQRNSVSRVRSVRTALAWICETRLSVTPRTWPISASVMPSK